ncbi:hypothetical protein PV08_00044 [Exophiala spinifera]|uniref:Uncharacterized protein n=1 Tax=Exophiala spinifera TaxID=91928 RepID=A0A0D2A3L7_9EURO|nr:uncharacterized protein PV08_00044 [Exophiala spinifera]KIW19472.1 hypothetical protein PV08_00044 [Exophiala spinifera]
MSQGDLPTHTDMSAVDETPAAAPATNGAPLKDTVINSKVRTPSEAPVVITRRQTADTDVDQLTIPQDEYLNLSIHPSNSF